MRITDRVSKGVRTIVSRLKVISICVLLYFAILILYDFLVYTRSMQERLVSYLSTLFICLFAWFGVKLVFYVQLKNKMGFPQFYNIFVICALIIFGLASIMLGIEYFIKGFSDGAFIAPVAFLSVLRVQIVRD